ncbi:MAG TPA: sugar ABC transporter permease, partial [Clostridiales bacterium]|nr:sugar ABC transporter permease [Clostridiales bacterium]
MLSPFLVFFVLFIAYPMVMSLYYSFTDYNLNTANFVGVRNYVRLTRDPVFGMAFQNTCVYALISVSMLFVLGFLTAAVLNRSFRGVAGLRMLMLYPYATSMTAVSMIFLMLFDVNSGVLNKILRGIGAQPSNWLFDPGLALYCLIFVNVWKNIGYCMLIYLSGMQTIDPALYEAATVDGAGEGARLIHITLPMLRPVALFVLITTMV